MDREERNRRARERYQTKIENDPEYRKKVNEKGRERHQKNKEEINRCKRERYQNDPEYRKKRSEYEKEKRKNDPEYRKKRSEYLKNYYQNNQEEIKKCHKEKYQNDPEYRKKVREKSKEKYQNDPEFRKRLAENEERTRLKQYGLTIEERDKMIKLQGNKCLSCKTELENKNKMIHVDHDHVSGTVRGILCNNCNSGIGSLGDNMKSVRNGARYLLKFDNPNADLLTMKVLEDDDPYFKSERYLKLKAAMKCNEVPHEIQKFISI